MKTIKTIILFLSFYCIFQTNSYAQCDSTSDVIQNTSNTNVDWGAGGNTYGNTFTPTCSGKIEGVSFWTREASGTIGGISMTVELYRNPLSNNPILLASQTQDIPFDNANRERYFVFDDEPDVVSGTSYGFRVTRNDTQFSVKILLNNNNPYSDGRMFLNDFDDDNITQNWDLRFRIHYLDEVAPNANCINITRTLGSNNTVSISTGAINNNSNDADSGIASVSISQNTFDCSDIGDNIVTLTVSDQNGNFNSCQATVTIVDANAPELTCPSDITFNTDPGVPTIVNYDDILYSDCTVETPDGFNLLGVWNNKSYFISQTQRFPSEAYLVAESVGGYLATIENAEQNEFIRAAVSDAGLGFDFLIGYNDINVEDNFVWHDPNATSTYSNWSTAEPNDAGAGEDYTTMNGGGRWNDRNNNFQRHYIIELSQSTIIQTAGLPSGSVFPVGTTTNEFEATDAFGNVGTCSFDVTVIENPFETLVELNGGKLTITDIENDSDDQITLSNDGTTLTISNLVLPTVSGGPLLIDATTVTVPLSSIIAGIEFIGSGGDDTIDIPDDLTLSGGDNDMILTGLGINADFAFQNDGHINIGGDFIISNSSNASILLGELTAVNFNISDVSYLRDTNNPSPITISGQTDIQTNGNIDFFSNSIHSFSGTVNLEAATINFSVVGPLTLGTVTTTNPTDIFRNDIRVSPGDLTLTADIVTAGDSDLYLRGQNTINQSGGTITTDHLVFDGRNNGETIATLFGDNDINTIEVATGRSMELIVFNDIDDLEIGRFTIESATLFATTINLTDDTDIFKNGTGVLSILSSGDLNITNSTNNSQAFVTHNGGSIEFQGTTIAVEKLFYQGSTGTTTRFLSPTTFNDIDLFLEFGSLQIQAPVNTGATNLLIELEDALLVDDFEGILSGNAIFEGGSTTVELDGTIAPGGGTTPTTLRLINNIEFNNGTYAPHIASNTSFDQLDVDGTVTLTDADFAPTGSFVPQPDDVEMILISNDDTDAVIGTFNNLPEGSVVTFGDYEGIISYVGGDGNDVTLSPIETTVDLTSGILTITDTNGGVSDDSITLSNDGTTLTISGLTAPVQISTGVTLVNGTSVSVPIADITNGFLFDSEEGNDTITINDPITINGESSFMAIATIDNFIQNAALTIGGNIFLEGTDSDLVLGEITAGSLNLRLFNNINDSTGRLNISDLAMRDITGVVNIDNGTQTENNHSFGNFVDIEAFRVANFTAGSDVTIAIRTTATNVENTVAVSPGSITLSGSSSTAGNSDLNLIATSSINQPVDASLTTRELTITASTTAVFLGETNDINRLRSTNPLELISFNDIDNLELGTITTSEFAFTASEIFIDTETLVTKTGSGVSTFTGNVLSDSIELGTINHEAGTIVFDGNTGLTVIDYNGQAGTTTRFIGEGAKTVPNSTLTFGTLESETIFNSSFDEITILDTAIFTGNNGKLTGSGILNGPVNITNDGAISPGGDFIGVLTTGNLNITSGTFETEINGSTTDLYDYIIVNGTVNLTDAILNPIGGFVIQPGDEVILINNDGTDAVTGIFNNLPEGSSVTFGNFVGIISYAGGDGNDIVLLADTEDPVAVCQDITLSIGINGLTVTGDQLDGGSSDNAAISEILINGQSSIDFTLADLGDTEVMITIIDPSGNTDECTATITLVSNVNATLPILISEYQPQTTDDPQSIEIIGEPGESFVGNFIVIEGDTDTSEIGVVLSADSFSGTFDANGLLTVTIPNIVGPTHTVVLTTSFSGTVGMTDIDDDDDGVADDLTAFGTILDAVGVGDGGACCPIDVLYGTDFGGVNLPSIGSVPGAIFREGSTGDFFQISTSSGAIFDSTGTMIDGSTFDNTPTVNGTFGAINPMREIRLRPKVFLQGPASNPITGQENLMRDDLRVADLVPTLSPYGDGATTTFSNGEPNNNSVDWVLVELRDATDSSIIIASQSALIQRDGDVVSVTGSDVSFNIPQGDYFVAIKHRNHLGIISANTVALSSSTTSLDFSADSTLANGDSLALVDIGNGVFAMYAGDASGDGNILNTDIINAISNLGGTNVYNSADSNMDGNILNDDITLFIQLNAGRIQQY
ncbi:hypothetical protein GCM10011344_00240 [Dokdonia pacifica]|uniref:HYR domain-containing protein n=1 Tax=Dokdonia pacifica TaxID=1627892 RepID=A0A239D4Z8_9FLAO|nr:HYR domain-containing protein [Dokdonia pacifica]GGG03858.1 hypothetical protein GCM10011344_00240 [Dokdonia pacifica]SNS26683.1 HYR domain-containing protein [Dokdonia pacifica]